MATANDPNAFERVYENSIGEQSTANEASGYWLFVLGLLAGLVGIALVIMSNSPGTNMRGAGIVLAALGLVLLLLGQTVRLPLKRSGTMMSVGGAVIAVIAIAWFVVAFNAGNWGSAFAHSESYIIGLYGLGILVMALGSVLTPLVVRPREEQLAAEARAARAEAERDAARDEIARLEAEDKRRAAALTESRKKQEAAELRASEAQAKRDTAMSETARQDKAGQQTAAATGSRDEESQSQFELYTDEGRQTRWRLRHDNGNIIADGAQGYSSRQKAMQGLDAVKRDAVEATVVDLDKESKELSDELDDSQSRFELYTDEGGQVRWRLRHNNGNIIADAAEGYSSRQKARQGLDAVKRDVVDATVLDLDEMDGDETAEEVTMRDESEQ